MGARPFVRSGAAVSLYLLFLVVYILFDGFQDKVGGRGRVQWETYPHSHTISVGYRVKIKEGKYNTRDARTSHCTRSKNTHTHTHTHCTLVRSVSSSSSSSLPTATREDEGKKKETHKSFFHRRRLALVFTHTLFSFFSLFLINTKSKPREGGKGRTTYDSISSAQLVSPNDWGLYICVYTHSPTSTLYGRVNTFKDSKKKIVKQKKKRHKKTEKSCSFKGLLIVLSL